MTEKQRFFMVQKQWKDGSWGKGFIVTAQEGETSSELIARLVKEYGSQYRLVNAEN